MYEPESRRGISSRVVLPIFLLVGLIIAGVAAFLFLDIGTGGGEDDTAQVEPTPEPTPTPIGSGPREQALGRFIETTLDMEYLGDCSAPIEQAQPTAAPGQQAPPTRAGLCSMEAGERQGIHAFGLAQLGSEQERWAFLEERGGNWIVAHAPAITAENRGVPGIPWPLALGVEVVVTGAEPCVNVRDGPSLQQAAVDALCDGQVITLGAGPAEADGYQWWQIEFRTGWVVADYLRYPDAIQ